MNKNELIEAVAAEANLTKAAASDAVAAFCNVVKDTLRKGDEVRLVGFGTFAVSQRAARVGKNPRTGEEIKIAASKQPKFKPGKELKASIS